jgi:hypothetical protein
MHKGRTENADAAHELQLQKLLVSAANGEDGEGARDDSPLPDSFCEWRLCYKRVAACACIIQRYKGM